MPDTWSSHWVNPLRLPHHLLRHPSGVYHFRLVVPRDLKEAVGKGVIKHSLRTRDVGIARAYAYALGARYAAAFAAFRSACMTKPPSVDEILRAAQGGGVRTYELDLPSGVRLKADGADDHARAMEALRMVLNITGGPSLPRTMPQAAPQAAAQGVTLGEAQRKYMLTFEGAARPLKSRSTTNTSTLGFVTWKGPKTPMASVTRTDVAEWLQTMRVKGLVTPTLRNKASFVTGFFAWAQSAGHYPRGDNPGEGQVPYSAGEKRQRRALGFRPLTPEQVAQVFAPAALATLNIQTRWGALVGLYTGTRVSEVGQLRLDDVFQDDEGIWCFRVTDEGLGQSLKNAASARVVPIHPHLIEMGLLDRVVRLRKAGKVQLFPRAKAGSVNGMGNWLSKAFARHLAALRVKPAGGKGKVGFHSLRKTFIQSLQKLGMASDVRAQLAGHELDDEHHAVYSRHYSSAELLRGAGSNPGLDRLRYEGLDISKLTTAVK